MTFQHPRRDPKCQHRDGCTNFAWKAQVTLCQHHLRQQKEERRLQLETSRELIGQFIITHPDAILILESP